MFDLKGVCHGCFASSGGRVLPHISRIGICSPKGYSFCAPLVVKRVKTFPILIWNRVWFSRELRGE